MKLYIYVLKELEKVMSFFNSVPPEMDLYDIFLEKLRKKYEIVNDINDADIAFIPIDYIKLIYGKVNDNRWHVLHRLLGKCIKYPDLIPSEQPRTFGVGYKENYINFFWSNFVKDKINTNVEIPHFILYNYVLFETSFDSIDKDIFILSYEDEVSFFSTNKTFNIGTHDRMITIPYVLNENDTYSLPEIKRVINSEKTQDLTFIGSLHGEDRPLIKRVRNFLTLLNLDIHIGDMMNINNELMNTKYLFVLRGDTPTRISFYQCLSYNIVPIIFEKELNLYQQIFTEDVDLKESCLILPDINDLSDITYSKIVSEILNDELSDPKNYTNKIKDHKKLFDQINYFSEECLPIENVIQKIKLKYSTKKIN
jgi:hypothetical protein